MNRLAPFDQDFIDRYEAARAAQRAASGDGALGQSDLGEHDGIAIQGGNVATRHIDCDRSCPICKGIHRYLALRQALQGLPASEPGAAHVSLGQQSHDQSFKRVNARNGVRHVGSVQDSLLKRVLRRIGAGFLQVTQ